MAQNALSILILAKDQASATLQKVGSNLDSFSGHSDTAERHTSGLGRSMVGLGGTLKTLAGAFGAYQAISLFTDQIGEAINRVDTLNNANRVFANMGFSAEATRKTMDALKASVLGLPTPLNEAVSNVEILASATQDLGRGQQVYSAMNDAILGFGGSSDMVKNATIQLSQAISNNRIDGQTWISMMNSGMGPVLNAIAKQMGITTGALQEGLSTGAISVQRFEDALTQLDSQGGGGLKSLHQIALDSTAGIGTGFDNMKTSITRGIADIIQTIGAGNISEALSNFGNFSERSLQQFSGALKEGIEWAQKLADQIGQYLGPKLQDLWTTVQNDLLPLLKRLWDEVGAPLADGLGRILVWAIGRSIDQLNLFLQTITPVINFLLDHKQAVLAVAEAFGALALAMKMQAVFDALTLAFNTFTTVTLVDAQVKLQAFRDLLASPVTMGAIGIAAALIAFQQVQDKAEETRRVIQDTQNAADNAAKSNQAVIKQLNSLIKSGTPEQKARAKKTLQALADNGSFASGGYTGAGSVNQVAGIVHKGEYVIPQSGVDQTTGLPKSTGSQTTNILSGNFSFSSAAAVDQFFARLDKTQRLARMGMAA